jgi:hypothetical protein
MTFFNQLVIGIRLRASLKFARIVCAVLVFSVLGSSLLAQNPSSKIGSAASQSAEAEKSSAIVDEFITDFEDDDLAGSSERAWEYRPYSVAVWFCLDGSPGLNAVYKNTARDVTRRSELLDPSGWDLATGLAPSRWRHRFKNYIETPEKLVGLEDLPALKPYDKLMVVCLSAELGTTNVRVREFDIQTQLWGPMVIRNVVQRDQLGRNVMDAISIAFMPLAKIEGVQEIEFTDDKGNVRKKDEVIMQIRAVRSCVRTVIDDEFQWQAKQIEDSPVFIRNNDRFLPIIRITDKKGDLVALEPIEFTFLTVNSMEDAVLKASIESNRSAPLSQRKSKKSQKLALVIRPPESSTRLFLVSDDKERTPMEGVEILSRAPDAPIEDKVLLGKTDWQGSIEIPPSPEGLRLILVKRGQRGLRRLPIMPGLYRSVVSTLPNDETRLYAEGVLQGLQNEILSLVIQRQVFENDTTAAIEKKDVNAAMEGFKGLKALSIEELKTKMNDEEVQLKSLTSDARELDFIIRRFESLRKILNDQQRKSKESELQEVIQEFRRSKLAEPVS